MLYRLRIAIKEPGGEKINHYKSSLFHGVLMESISGDYATEMHTEGLRPYTQSLIREDGVLYWQITALTERAAEEILTPLMNPMFRRIKLRHNNLTLELGNKQFEQVSYQDLFEKYYQKNCPDEIRIRLVTPTAFKRDGEFINYPNIRLIYNSLVNKFNAVSPDPFQNPRDIVAELEEATRLHSYELKSGVFALDGTKINTFSGSMGLRVKASQEIVGLAHTLVDFGTFSGVGVKTAIGMGTIEKDKI